VIRSESEDVMMVTSCGFETGATWDCDFSELTVNFINLKDNLMVFTAEGVNFDKFKLGGLHEKYAIAT
jgi:hypothetical protein